MTLRTQVKLLMQRYALTEAQASALAALIWGTA